MPNKFVRLVIPAKGDRALQKALAEAEWWKRQSFCKVYSVECPNPVEVHIYMIVYD